MTYRLKSMEYLSRLTALQHLRLAGTLVVIALLPQCPGLVELQLVHVGLNSPAKDMLLYLGSLTQLSRMQLAGMLFTDGHGWCVEQGDEPSAAAACSAYTALAPSNRLKHWGFTAGTDILDIEIIDYYDRLPAVVWDQFLHTGLQQAALEIESLQLDWVPFKELSACSKSALRQLKTLQKLVLSNCWMDSTVLSALTQLTYLKLASVDVRTNYYNGDYAFDFDDCADTDAGLLELLLNLTQLRHLELSDISNVRMGGEAHACCFDPECPNCDLHNPTAWPCNLPAFTALFASSQLQHLHLDGQNLPAGALRHALAGAQQLPHLTVLRLGADSKDALDSTSIASLARRMPALQSCSMRIAPGAQLAALGQLPALRTLEAGVYGSSTLAEVATALTRLEVLSIYCLSHDSSSQDAAAGISSEHLAALTALRQLRTLRFQTFDWHVSLIGNLRSNDYNERLLRLNLQSQVC
jgi:hypothetical protein